MKTKRHEGRDEAILEPDMPIVDSHHHLFDRPGNRYIADDLLADVNAGHKVLATIYCETQAFNRISGPDWLRPLGEVEFANGVGAAHASGLYGPTRLCAGIIGHADLRFGARIGELLDRCIDAAPERYRGVRHVTIEYPDDRPFQYVSIQKPPAGLLDDPAFHAGLAEVAQRGLVFDAAIFNPSLPKVAELADRFPQLSIVLNHMGTAVGVDMSAAEKAETFDIWRRDLRAVAQRDNIRCKVGGLGMPMWGFGFEDREHPLGYAELAQAWAPYIDTAIEAFGPGRCMMESNFPPDGRSCGYVPLWNALKHLTLGYSPEQREQMFYSNALSIYSIDREL
jgi:L-fuconolactonase